MSWVRTDYDFGVSYARFVVSFRAVAVARHLHGILVDFDGKPEQVERVLYDFVIFHRPDLAGGQVTGFKKSYMAYEIEFWHPSLSKLTNGMQPQNTEFPIPLPERQGEVFVPDSPAPPLSGEVEIDVENFFRK